MLIKNKIKTSYLASFILSVSFLFAFLLDAKAQSSAMEPGVMTEVDENPLPSGGMEGMYEYFAKNMKYPELAKEKGIEGTVVATFLVQKDGSLTDVEILRGIGGYCDEEAIRLIKSMEKWQPGKLKGEAVVTRMRIPVRFKLENSR
jgi:TonB family protein